MQTESIFKQLDQIFYLNYSSRILGELSPYLEKVKERVSIGISDPIELAIFFNKI